MTTFCRAVSYRSILIAGGLLATLAGAVPAANAEIVRFNFSGTVEVRDPDQLLPPDIVSGLPFSGWFAFDRGLPDSNTGNPNWGSFAHLPPVSDQLGIDLRVGSLVIVDDPIQGFKINTANDALLGLTHFGEPTPPIGDVLNTQWGGLSRLDLARLSIRFYWTDLTGTSLDTEAIPSVIDPLRFMSPLMDHATIDIDGHTLGTVTTGPLGFEIIAHLEHVSAVPEPSGDVIWSAAMIVWMWILSRAIRLKR